MTDLEIIGFIYLCCATFNIAMFIFSGKDLSFKTLFCMAALGPLITIKIVYEELASLYYIFREILTGKEEDE